MILQVSGVMSRGDFSEKHMKGRSLFEFIPVNNNALGISPCLEKCLKYWLVEYVDILDPVGWFIRGHDIYQDPRDK